MPLNVTKTPEGNLLTYDADGLPVIYNLGDMAWVATATVIVGIMPIGLGLLYSGLLRRRNALSMIFLALTVYSVGLLHWFMLGYSLTYGPGNAFIGDSTWFGLVGVDIKPSPGSTAIPALLYEIYQAQFQAITVVILVAGTAERGRLAPLLILAFAWSTLVYNPVAHWVWSSSGWLYNLGDLDYAGGGPVHIASGVGSFVISAFVGKRRGYGTPQLDYRPHSSFFIALGTAFLWFGWCCFNGASNSALNLKSIMNINNTLYAGAAGCLGWTAVDFAFTRKWSAVGAASGILAGLIGITPAVGYVAVPAAFGIGLLTAIACNLATGLKRLMHVDDAVDAGALHAAGGIVGAILTGIFADSRVADFDGLTEIDGGWINGYWRVMGLQLAGVTSIVFYTAVMTYVLLFLINLIPGCKFRSTEEAEIVGIDEEQLGEFAYDYLELRRDIKSHKLYSNSPTLSATNERGRPADARTATSASHESKEGVEGRVSQVREA
ncbi:uncharacterized protein RHOBADRAFT_44929 [Rhodotorula graminis WP1]|uniref:Ammonium transporter n=1 Tax=Rhodotorula graminis (strain WP1) TaxID=578459 RepID=A0A194S1P8_RHOGW|nr:uncharacterized protein RHOBADRAFT_44929 [Rhodotorula graminis WP1]KPV74439.1 hypothetical protein RHOBADRAFT_44929 [Rhodotorula graminis WP1]